MTMTDIGATPIKRFIVIIINITTGTADTMAGATGMAGSTTATLESTGINTAFTTAGITVAIATGTVTEVTPVRGTTTI